MQIQRKLLSTLEPADSSRAEVQSEGADPKVSDLTRNPSYYSVLI
jgi:hypothetical protein